MLIPVGGPMHQDLVLVDRIRGPSKLPPSSILNDSGDSVSAERISMEDFHVKQLMSVRYVPLVRE